jgi:hypothetical protein
MLPKRTDRALFLGQTGSGKTTLARRMLWARHYAVIYDGKGTIDWPGYRIVTGIGKAERLDPVKVPRIIYRPPIEEASDPKAIETFFRWIYERGNCTLYVDEVYSVAERTIPQYYSACMTRGRERGIEVWNSVQRPSRIPLSVLTEAENYYVFRLTLRDDRKRVEECTGMPERNLLDLPKHRFYVARLGDRAEGPYLLDLGEETK